MQLANILSHVFIGLFFLILLVGALWLKQRIRWKLLRRYPSKVSKYVDVSQKYNGEIVLMTNYFVQGVSTEKPSIKESYWYAIAKKIVRHCQNKKQPKVLFIGLGANTSSRLIEHMDERIYQVIVEIDPVVIQACQDFFHLDEMKQIEVVQADIYDLLKKKKSVWANHFDVIVIDTFDAKPPYLLNGSHDPIFLRQLYRWLKKDGNFLINIPVKTKGIHVKELLDYLQGIFQKVNHTIIYDPRGYQNHVISAAAKK